MTLQFTLPWIAVIISGLWSSYYIVKANTNYDKANRLWLDSIPSLLTTSGVFGTFLGIVLGLQDFQTNNIDASISQLLDGLKAAFWTSIMGITLSIIYGKIIEKIQFDNESGESGEEVKTELDALNKMTGLLEDLKKSIAGDGDQSISSQLVKLRTSIRDNQEDIGKDIKSIRNGLVGDEETSLNTQIQKLRDENKSFSTRSTELQEVIVAQQQDSKSFLDKKLDEFGELLEKSNTEALVKAIENVIGGFNERLNELIERLVKENFEELNNSVNRLNDWQKENKDQVERLITQYKEVSDELSLTERNLKSISENTNELTKDNGKLADLIKELQSVLTDETKFRDSIEMLNDTTSVFQKASQNLNDWMEDQKSFSDRVSDLIDALKEIEELRNNTDGFFDDIKEKLLESVSIIGDGNTKLKQDIERIESSFNDRMNKSFVSLDKVLQSMVTEYADRMNKVS